MRTLVLLAVLTMLPGCETSARDLIDVGHDLRGETKKDRLIRESNADAWSPRYESDSPRRR